MSTRTHRRQVEAANAGYTQEQIRANKCARRRERHAAITAANKQRAEDRVKPDPMTQLKNLDYRLGVGKGAKKERARLYEAVTKVA